MTKLIMVLGAVRTFSLLGWLSGLCQRAVYNIVHWCMTKQVVQDAIVDSIKCKSPIGRALHDFTDEKLGDAQDANDVAEQIDEALDSFEIDAGNIKHLDDEVKEILENTEGFKDTVEQAVDELVNDGDRGIIRLIAQRLSY
jgi:hypothetical protein